MTSIELKDRLAKAEEKVIKCENTIERHMKQLEKRQAKLLRVEWMAQYMEDLTVYSDKNEAMEEAIKAVDEYYKDTVYPDTRLGGLSRVFTLSEEDIKSSGYVVDSLEASIWCLYNSNSYTEAVLRAVNLGTIYRMWSVSMTGGD